MRLAVTGATGRMAREVRVAAAERDDAEVVVAASRCARETGAVDRSADEAGTVGPHADEAGGDEGGVLDPAGSLPDLLVEREPDVLVDFTVPESSVEYVAAAAEAGVPAVVGTTGFDDEGVERLRAAAEDVAVLRASNFARGVQALLSAAREALAALPDYDVEVTETHHAGKRDAPSGTAKTVLAAVDAVRETRRGDGTDGEGRSERVHGREGTAPRGEGEVGVHARRAGDVTGEHEVLLAGNHETVRLSHRAGSRRVFAEGALDAAAWLAGREAGRYEFAEVLDA